MLTHRRPARAISGTESRAAPSLIDIEQRRQSQLLNVVLITLTALVALTGIRSFYYTFIVPTDNWYVLLVCVVEVIVGVPLIALNRSGRYKLSARIFVGIATILIGFFAYVDDTGAYFGTLIVVISTIFLTFSEAVVVAVVVTFATLLLSYIAPVTTAVFFVAYVAALLLAFKQTGSASKRSASKNYGPPMTACANQKRHWKSA